MFAALIIYMAVQSLTNGYQNPMMRGETRSVLEEKEAFVEEVGLISQQMKEKYGVWASISIAQAILESDWGKSDLTILYNNLYGVKTNDPSQSALMKTTEYVNGKAITVQASFKVYDSFYDSIEDHAQLMAEGTSWDNTLYHRVLQASTYQEAAKALQTAGYATDPNYHEKIIELIEQYELYQYDQSS
ncbi:glycoside hydrolase family 73 protein [Jeotgalibaca sp. MA1X17-3]|uniref:glycoside hydrolase family 73 protein n=1 Tax=Jeotgalibaca sp. MA1X17-3 TaxID=2908211 RepID=UPI001F2298D2|nr:glycoside hydrolase family 73 protein [Jeotgalibaca sp. MA1X17-3]UJF15454.1 glycoside hydrolase family 73 protein [Jeotgalibaca sp. MA1X17-3]